MNIFAVDDDATLSAHQLPDKHIVKMPLECCQMLSIVYSSWYHNIGKVFKADGTPYKTEKGAFRNHPCTKWVAESDHNIQWLIQHGISLCEEYTYRYEKTHASQALIEWCSDNVPNIPTEPMSTMPQCMPDEYKSSCSVESYRKFYNIDKRNSFKCVWTKRQEPEWWE